MAKKNISSAADLGQEIINLPFVKKRTKGMARNHFWSIEPTGDFTKDCQTGMAYAVLAREFMKKKHFLKETLRQISSTVHPNLFQYPGQFLHQVQGQRKQRVYKH